MSYVSYTDRMQVTVPEGEVDGLAVQRFEVRGGELWNLRAALRDGRACVPGVYTRLIDYNAEGKGSAPGLLWMSDTTAERDDHKEAVARIQMSKAERVLINGLGLGMVLQAALSYGHVRHVDVVEADERVIKLVGPHYTADPRVNIIHADAYAQIKNWPTSPKGERWDVAWSDIWPTISADNLDGMDRLHAFYRKWSGWHGMWQRRQCLALRRELRAYGLL